MINRISKEQSQKTLLSAPSTQSINNSTFSTVLTKIQIPTVNTHNNSLDALFNRASATYNVPLNLLKSVAKAESSFNANAVSSCGAQGIMQLMPQTATELGVKNPFDPEQNIMGGAKCLAQKLKLYDGDIKLTLASYNAGSGNVKKYGGIPPFPETKRYVEKVINYMNDYTSAPQDNVAAASNLPAYNPLISSPNTQTPGDITNLSDTASNLSNLMSQIRSIQATAMMLQYQTLVSDNDSSTFSETDYQKLLNILNN